MATSIRCGTCDLFFDGNKGYSFWNKKGECPSCRKERLKFIVKPVQQLDEIELDMKEQNEKM